MSYKIIKVKVLAQLIFLKSCWLCLWQSTHKFSHISSFLIISTLLKKSCRLMMKPCWINNKKSFAQNSHFTIIWSISITTAVILNEISFHYVKKRNWKRGRDRKKKKKSFQGRPHSSGYMNIKLSLISVCGIF